MRKWILKTILVIVLLCTIQVTSLAVLADESNQNGVVVKVENDDESYKIGYLESMPIEMDEKYISTDFIAANTYSASTPSVIGFFDYKGFYNVVHIRRDDDWKLKGVAIKRYDSNLKFYDFFEIKTSYESFGNVITDSEGNYYITWGQADYKNENCIVIIVCKYDYSGNLIGKCEMTGYDTAPYSSGDYWGTKIPFDAGTCSMDINNGILACNYAREMYSGHQSNYAIYVDCTTMERVQGSIPYSSHSFDQRVVATSDGGFLMLNHGDAYYRAFCISKIDSGLRKSGELHSFHFREGSDRAYGYNETYAQLGGIVETDNAYILCASSERTLSKALAPTNEYYCGHSEARDLFVQILKKDYYDYNSENAYLVQGDVRVVTGERPETTENHLYLTGEEVDYGVIWLTKYDDEYYVGNPYIINVDNKQSALLWEKRNYEVYDDSDIYFALINDKGTYTYGPVKIGTGFLAGNISPEYKDGKIYWTTVDQYQNAYINSVLVVENEIVLDAPIVKTENDNAGVKLTWNRIDMAEGYYIYRMESNGKYQVIGSVNDGSKLEYMDKTVEAGISYTYTVGAFNKNGNYATTYYSEGARTTYVAPPKINGFKANSKGITIIWNKTVSAERYRVFRKNASGKWEMLGETNKNFYVDTNVTSDAPFVYTVRCITGDSKKYTSGYQKSGVAYTGMSCIKGEWYYITEGKIDTAFTGLAKGDNEWWYLTKGKFDATYTGMAKNKHGWWYVKEGKIDRTYTGLVKYKTSWIYVNKGKLDTGYTGLVKYKSKWVYVCKGKLDASYTGLVKYKSSWVYVNKGKLDATYTGMAKNKYGWWYVSKGKLDLTYTGISHNAFGRWYLKNGKLDITYTGTVIIDGNKYRIVKGKVK